MYILQSICNFYFFNRSTLDYFRFVVFVLNILVVIISNHNIFSKISEKNWFSLLRTQNLITNNQHLFEVCQSLNYLIYLISTVLKPGEIETFSLIFEGGCLYHHGQCRQDYQTKRTPIVRSGKGPRPGPGWGPPFLLGAFYG